MLVVLSALTILLTTSCKKRPTWTWQADFFIPDHVSQDLSNQDMSKVVNCWEPEFEDFACLSLEGENGVEGLEKQIEKMKRNYKDLFSFHKSVLKSQIKLRKEKGEETEDLNALLELTEKEFKLRY